MQEMEKKNCVYGGGETVSDRQRDYFVAISYSNNSYS